MYKLRAVLVGTAFALATGSALPQSPSTQPIPTTGPPPLSKMSTDDAKKARAEAKAKWDKMTPEEKAAYQKAAAAKKREELSAMEEIAANQGPVFDANKAKEEAAASKTQPLPTKQERQGDLKGAEAASAKGSGSKSGVPQN